MTYKQTRAAGLMLLALAASCRAIAAAVAPPGVPLDEAAWGGMKLLHLTLSAAAAGASLFFVPQFSGRALGATVTCGILFGTAGPPAVAWAVSWYTDGRAVMPGPVLNLVAIVLGIVGVYIIPALNKMGAAFAAKPFSFIPWFRSGGTTPGPDEVGKEGRP